MTIRDKPKTRQKYELVNLSGKEPDIKIDERGLEKLVVLPDYESGVKKEGVLPDGVVAVYSNEHVPNFEVLGHDVGRGFSLVKIDNPNENFDRLAKQLREKLKKPVDFAENDSITFYRFLSHEEDLNLKRDDLVALISTGADISLEILHNLGLCLDDLDNCIETLAEGKRIREYLRGVVHGLAHSRITPLLDSPLISFERTDSGTIYRKGAQRVKNGDYGVVTFGSKGALLVKAEDSTRELGSSLPFRVDSGKKLDDNLSAIKRYVFITGVLKYLTQI